MRLMKHIICFFLCFLTLAAPAAYAEGTVETDAKAVLLMEADTGEVLYEENADERLPIASVTKIMTMLLIAEAVDGGKIKLDDMVPVSENAMSYGGSTMFLEAGEELSVSDMLKGIAVASANDGCVAMAEFLEGSETAFVEKMNEKASELGMENTSFMNTNGLDEDGHYSSARDVAVMSRELMTHPLIFDYTTIWTDTLRNGKFSLANTNKLIRFYNGANGLKTGSTSQALCCISAAAKRGDMQLIAVVLGAPTSAKRFSSAKALLDYGFANYKTEKVLDPAEELERAPVSRGVSPDVGVRAAESYTVLRKKSGGGEITTETVIDEPLRAPINEGDTVGRIIINDGETAVEKDAVAAENVMRKSFVEILTEFIAGFMARE